jgi:hypothetical protein
VVVFAVEWVYVLSGIKLAMCCIALNGIYVVVDWFRAKKAAWLDLLVFVLSCVWLPALIVLNPPYFRGVRTYANNPGWIYVKLPAVAVIILALALLAVAVAIFRHYLNGRSDLVRPAFLLATSIGFAVAGIVHWANYYIFGVGVSYGVAKHLFGLGTLFVASVVALAFDATSGKRRRILPASIDTVLATPAARGVLPVLFGFGALAVVVSNHAVDLRAFLQYDQEVRRVIVADPDLYAKSYSANESLPPGFNFAINVVVLTVGPSYWEGVRSAAQFDYILISLAKNPTEAVDPACIVPTHERPVSFRLVHRRCWTRWIAYERSSERQ